MIIEVNGKFYEKIEHEKRKVPRMVSSALPFLMLGGLMGVITSAPQSRKESHSNIDIVKEYGLIQKKESRLPRSKRDWIVRQFERNFKQIENL